MEDSTGRGDTDDAQGCLLATLQQILEIQATETDVALDQATHLVAEALGADKVDAFLHDPATDTLVAFGTSDTPMGRRQKAIGMDRMPLVNGGRVVEVYRDGEPYCTGRADEDPGELVGITRGLGVRSSLAVPLEVNGQRRGVLLASSAQPERFSGADLRFLRAVSRWVGSLVHRTELVQDIARAAAEQGRRAAAEELVTVLAHDLSNYLTPLQARLEMLRRRASREERDRDAHDVAEALSALGRFGRLIGDLLDVARLEQGLFGLTPQPTDLVTLVRQSAEALRTDGVSIRVSGPDDVIAQVDPSRAHQALENLLANAVKHSPAGGEVVVEIAVRPRLDGEWASICIADQGPGVPEELIPRLFERFAAGGQSRGLGLGLYLARCIAEAHGGGVRLQSTSPTGSRFCLELPLRAT
jgi:signal transduction histidine kinase